MLNYVKLCTLYVNLVIGAGWDRVPW